MNYSARKQFSAMTIAFCIVSMFISACGSKSSSSPAYGSSSKAVVDESKKEKTIADENAAFNRLTAVLSDKVKEGTVILPDGEADVNGQICWKFSFGSNASGKFTAEEHYCVTKDGKVYLYDPINDTYTIVLTAITDENTAFERLTAVLGDKIKEGTVILPNGEADVDEQTYWKFSLGSNTPGKFTAEEHYCVTKDGKVYLYDLISDTYTIVSMGIKPLMPLVKVDTRGMEELSINTEYLLDDILYIALESYHPFVNNEDYDEKTIADRIRLLEEGKNIKIENVVFSGMPSKDYSGGLGYPTWTITYEADENEETVYCKDLYFKTSFGEYRVHASVPIDAKQKYLGEIDRRFDYVVLASPLTMDITGMREYTSNCEYALDFEYGTVYTALRSYASSDQAIDKKTLTARIKELNGYSYIEDIKVTKYEGNLDYPAYIITYRNGRNEDTSFCTDLYFQTDSNEHWVQMSLSTHDDPAIYEDEIMKRIATVSLDCYYTDMRYQ